ncbi:MAG: hypothetical protein HYZ72_10520 [Deltaproteobacteria bacterium]|nr:hypothetical protein [Deltaproteobacteria bacterium]
MARHPWRGGVGQQGRPRRRLRFPGELETVRRKRGQGSLDKQGVMNALKACAP